MNKLSIKNLLLSVSAACIVAASPSYAQEDSQTVNGQTRVSVEDSAPRVDLEQPAPRVNVKPHDAHVDVHAGDPEVSINQPEPQVEIDQPEPEVSIQQAEPEVVVNSAEPVVNVRQEKPEVTIEKSEPKINVVREGSDGSPKAQHQTSSTLLKAELDSLEGKEVVTSEGEKLGEVEKVVTRDTGDTGFVVSVGGMLGIGGSEIFVPAEQSHLESDKIVWTTSLSTDEIEKSAKIQSDQYQPVSDEYKTLSEVREAS